MSIEFLITTFVIVATPGTGARRDKVISRPKVMLRMRRIFAGSSVAPGGRLATVTR